MTDNKDTGNINFFFTETEKSSDDLDLNDLLNKLSSIDVEDDNTESLATEIINYELNYTVKQLMLICDYYGILKGVRNSKCNKNEIACAIVLFENNINNFEVCFKRKQLWEYINELKRDKFMKKYVLWN